MRWAGIDIGKGRHAVVVTDGDGKVTRKAVYFSENAASLETLVSRLGPSKDLTVVIEATGHYWRNLALWLVDRGYTVVVLNPVQTASHARTSMRRAKTDATDAENIASCARGLPKDKLHTFEPDEEHAELRELSRWRARQVQDLGDRVRQLHRQVDLVFPELTQSLKDLSTRRALAILQKWPTAKTLVAAGQDQLAALVCDRRGHRVGPTLAARIVSAAKATVAQHSGSPYELIIPQLCHDILQLLERVADLDERIAAMIKGHELGTILATAPGIGAITAACILAEVGDPSRYRSPAELSADVGVVPGVHQSGASRRVTHELDPRGKGRLRKALWMPTLIAVRNSPWLKRFYDGLIARGKRPKVAMIASMHKLLHAIYAISKRRSAFAEPAWGVAEKAA